MLISWLKLDCLLWSKPVKLASGFVGGITCNLLVEINSYCMQILKMASSINTLTMSLFMFIQVFFHFVVHYLSFCETFSAQRINSQETLNRAQVFSTVQGEGPKNPIPSSVPFVVVGGQQEIPGKVFYNLMGIIISFWKKRLFVLSLYLLENYLIR